MDILQGNFKVVGLSAKGGKVEVLTRKLDPKKGLQRVDLLKINEQQAETLVQAGCKFIEKVEAKKTAKS